MNPMIQTSLTLFVGNSTGYTDFFCYWKDSLRPFINFYGSILGTRVAVDLYFVCMNLGIQTLILSGGPR